MNVWALVSMALVAAMTYYLGKRSSRFANTTHDFLLARRTVRSRRNAAAISGEYLSAASFLGVAGIVLKEGADALWYPIGFTAGYLALMLFVAAPLRRSGAYTLPDFLEARLGSQRLRTVSTWFVILIGILYMVPQLQGAGLTIATLMPSSAPTWIGAAVVTAIVTANVLGGGMRAITVVQAFQYWLKLFAIALPAFVLSTVFVIGGAGPSAGSLSSPGAPVFPEETTVSVETGVTLEVRSETPVWLPAESPNQTVWLPGYSYEVGEGTSVRFPAGAPVPVVAGATADNSSWLRPSSSGPEGLLSTYSLIFATFLGTMGLPHVLVRFYTNPDGKAARRTTVHVLLLLGLFYLFPTILGALSRMYVPELLMTDRTDAAVLLLPSAILPGIGGNILGAIVAAGAFAAFLSTSSGLLVSVAGVVSTDVLRRGRVRDFRLAALLVALVALVCAVSLHPADLSLSVGMSFALAASTFCPLLVLGIWWRKLTWAGAMAGICVGGGLVVAALAFNVVSGYTTGWSPWFLEQPALFTVPAAFLVTVLVSLGTARSRPDDLNAVMLQLHAPDPLGFMRDRAVERFGKAEERLRLGKGRHRK